MYKVHIFSVLSHFKWWIFPSFHRTKWNPKHTDEKTFIIIKKKKTSLAQWFWIPSNSPNPYTTAYKANILKKKKKLEGSNYTIIREFATNKQTHSVFCVFCFCNWLCILESPVSVGLWIILNFFIRPKILFCSDVELYTSQIILFSISVIAFLCTLIISLCI